jgi:hypothetical protein
MIIEWMVGLNKCLDKNEKKLRLSKIEMYLFIHCFDFISCAELNSFVNFEFLNVKLKSLYILDLFDKLNNQLEIFNNGFLI